MNVTSKIIPVTSPETIASELLEELANGIAVTGMRLRTPLSNALDELEHALASGYPSRQLKRDTELYVEERRNDLHTLADPIPANILSAMKLSEYYVSTEGDLWETMQVPMDLGLQEIVLEGGDKRVRAELEALYSDDVLDMNRVLSEAWTCLEIYGNAFPFEIWNRKEPQEIVLLDPKQVHVGSTMFSSGFVIDKGLSGQFRQQLESLHLDRDLAWQSAGVGDSNAQASPVGYFHLSDKVLSHLKARGSLPFHRYAQPPLSRVFRTLSTRQMLEEMMRASIEGIRNQLWLYLLGDSEHMPSKAEISALKAAVAASAGERTGAMVWYGNLRVEQHIPKTDDLLGNDKWMSLTYHLYRQRGISLRVVSGESPDRTAGNAEIDVRMLVQRIGAVQRTLIGFLKRFNRKWVELNSPTIRTRERALANMPEPGFLPITLETTALIRDVLNPMMMAGKISDHSYLRRAGLNYDQELAYKRAEEVNSPFFAPQPIYKQQVERVGEGTTSTTSNPSTPMRPGERDPGQASNYGDGTRDSAGPSRTSQ